MCSVLFIDFMSCGPFLGRVPQESETRRGSRSGRRVTRMSTRIRLRLGRHGRGSGRSERARCCATLELCRDSRRTRNRQTSKRSGGQSDQFAPHAVGRPGARQPPRRGTSNVSIHAWPLRRPRWPAHCCSGRRLRPPPKLAADDRSHKAARRDRHRQGGKKFTGTYTDRPLRVARGKVLSVGTLKGKLKNRGVSRRTCGCRCRASASQGPLRARSWCAGS